MLEEARHLQGSANGVGGTVDARLGLLERLGRQHAERHRYAGLDRRQLQPARRLARDVVEVRRLAADHAPERDNAGVLPGLRECDRRDRQLEGARDGDDRDRLALDAGLLELVQRALEQPARDSAVELGHDDADGLAAATLRAGEHLVAGRNLELTRCVFRLLFRLFLVRLLLVGRPQRRQLAHLPSVLKRRSWWWRRWPSLSRLVSR